MRPVPQDLKQIERRVRRSRIEFAPPDDLLDRVRATLAARPQRRRAGARGWAPRLTGAVAIALLAILLVRTPAARRILGPRPPLVAVVAVRGPVQDGNGQGLAIGDRLPGGATVVTGARGRVTLVTRRGSEFTLAADSRLALARDGKRASLESGRLYCRDRAQEFAAISTVAGTIALLGTTLDAATKDRETVAVTVVQGRVLLENGHGAAVVAAGEKAILTASASPQEGQPINVAAETAWYQGRGDVLSAAGDTAYLIQRGDGLATELWVMHADGSGKHRVKTYTGTYWSRTGPWLPGRRSLPVEVGPLAWTNPDFARHQARWSHGGPILIEPASRLGAREWVLDVTTGQDAPFVLPAGYQAFYKEASPNGRLLAFSGRYQPDPKSLEHEEGGIWVYDLTTGAMKKVLDGGNTTPISWSPDSRLLATSDAKDYGTSYPLVIIDVATGEVRHVHVQMQGAGASFSPDGTKLAFCGDFQKGGSWHGGVPTSGSIFVLDLKTRGEPRRLSPAGEGSLMPRWSPDGKRLLYATIRSELAGNGHRDSFRLSVAGADGTGSREVYSHKGLLRAAEWSPAGNALYIITIELNPGGHKPAANRILRVAIDGSGKVKDLGGAAEDSILPPQERAQTEAAFADLREAVYQFEVGKIRSYEGRAKEAKAAFRSAADIFAALVWKHPLAGFATADLAAYVDQIEPLANQSDDALFQETCQQRITHFLSWALLLYAGRERRFPPDLATVERWSLTTDWGMKIEWIDNTDAEWVKMIFRCPEGDSYVFHPTPNRAYPKVGDVIATCPNHPECRLVWTEGLAGMLRERLGIEANMAQQRRK
ncbi:MAG: FecR domain-containing protein [Armatimonadota bacterium]